MPNNNKARGSNLERKIVKIAEAHGLKAQRAWLSDGRSMGYTEDVDGVIYDKNDEVWKFQAKKRKKIAEYIFPNKNVHIQVIEEDYGKPHVVIQLDDFLELIK